MIWHPLNIMAIGSMPRDGKALALADIGDALPPYVWIAAGAIVLIGLLGLGLRDLARFSITRVWAIGGVCFRESIRRRVLWVIPLAIVGVVVVSQLQKVIDEQDAVRQVTKFCLFATGLVVVMTTIILASTSLPKEIDNRVIYTIVTKPTTRLEVILGKIIGFARVSAVILIIMGLFSYGYLSLRAWQERGAVVTRLQTDATLGPVTTNTLQHYADVGLLSAKLYAHPESVEIVSSIPKSNLPLRSISGDDEEELLFQYSVDRPRMFGVASNNEIAEGMARTGALIGVKIAWRRYGPEDTNPAHKSDPSAPAFFGVHILNDDGFDLVSGNAMAIPTSPKDKDIHAEFIEAPASNAITAQISAESALEHGTYVWVYAPPNQAGSLFQKDHFSVLVFGRSHNVEYWADPSSVVMMISPPPPLGLFAPPLDETWSTPGDKWIRPDNGPDGRPAPPLARGRLATRGGQQLTGMPLKNEHCPVAILHVRAADLAGADFSGGIPIEIKTAIERGGDIAEESDAPTELSVFARNSAGDLTGPVDMKLETHLSGYATIPASSFDGRDFDVLVKCNTAGHLLTIDTDCLSLVIGSEPFVWNLTKSLFILWMLTVLVVALAVFSSTFLSWPIALVLTIVLLLGHWCVTQVADAADKTLGRSIVNDWGVTDASKAEAVAQSVNALSSALTEIGAVLPDIDRFGAIDAIERGEIVSGQDLREALGVLLGFGLPAITLAYLILKQKEVAP